MTFVLRKRSLIVILRGALVLAAFPAHAQYIESFFQPTVPGFDRQAGVTVLSRLRPLYEQPGIRLGSFVANGSLDERVGFDSNITGIKGGPSSALVRTTPQVSAVSDWSRNRLGVSAGLDNYSYLSASKQDYTNYNASIGGGYTIGRHDLNVGYSHLRLHQLGTDIGAIATSTPIAYDVDAIRGDYTFDAGRFSFIPNVDARLYQFGTGVVGGQPTSQSYRDRTVLTGGVTTRYELSDQRSALLIVQGSSSHYVRPQPGATSNNSKTVLMLAGIDYQATGPWRYRLLVGGEVRDFESPRFSTRAAPVVVASLIWTPTGLTTLTGTVRREIEDVQAEGTAGYTYTTVQLIADHELRRNVLLQGRSSFQAAEYLQGGGSSTSVTVGGGATWLVNRRLRVYADYDFTRQTGSGGGAVTTVGAPSLVLTPGISSQLNTVTTGNYSRNLVLFGVRIGL